MNLNSKLVLREKTLWSLLLLVRPLTVVTVWLSIHYWKAVHFGLLYRGKERLVHMTWPELLRTFYQVEVRPILGSLLVLLVAEILIIGPLIRRLFIAPRANPKHTSGSSFGPRATADRA